jgi:hypothetical protein
MESLREEMNQTMDKYADHMQQLREEMSFKEQQIDRRMQIYTNEMESLREEMNQTMDKYSGQMDDLREEMEM